MKLSLNNKIRILMAISFIIIFAFLYNKSYFSFFALNLFLAYIPFEVSNIVNFTNNKFIILIAFIPWLLFYPNAPYLLTDFVHIEVLNLYGAPFSDDLMSWLLFSLSTFFILFGFFVGIISLIRVCKKLNSSFFNNNKYSIILLIIIFSIIAGYGIYLGRFPRLHTHYLINNPLQIFKTIIDNISVKSLAFSVIMGAWQIPFGLLLLNKTK